MALGTGWLALITRTSAAMWEAAAQVASGDAQTVRNFILIVIVLQIPVYLGLVLLIVLIVFAN